MIEDAVEIARDVAQKLLEPQIKTFINVHSPEQES